ncbi:hypothetical protein FEM48_Zijuj07G0015700 [Ziziphus jujuba var. spinosa]|uniref:Uncharacterized protein n=1 Tax=Ziziphus jujuba var. spinosa TaxID=714518 RepID=A0A978V1P2_ZIZJJ|nr:hypothetical protein FEM48_Zijuj07G0015700 [Ziziphus jujuba var. spinosa]
MRTTSKEAVAKIPAAPEPETSEEEEATYAAPEAAEETEETEAKAEDDKAAPAAEKAIEEHGMLRKSSDAKSNAVKIPTSDQLSVKQVDPARLEVRPLFIRTKNMCKLLVVRLKLTVPIRLHFSPFIPFLSHPFRHPSPTVFEQAAIRDTIDKLSVSNFATITLVGIESEDVQVYVNYFDIIPIPCTIFFFNAHHMKMDSEYYFFSFLFFSFFFFHILRFNLVSL